MHGQTDLVEIEPVGLDDYRAGNTGIPYVHEFCSSRPGPTATITAIVHGNELCGAIAVAELLQNGFRPQRGRLILGFMNVDAYQSFNAAAPGLSRYGDEDFNRVWSEQRLDDEDRTSRELTRAREVRSVIERSDFLLDLHSTSGFSPPMILSGLTDRAREFALSLGLDIAVVRDAGHAEGRRMRDFGAFADPDAKPTALLVECGQHWKADTVATARNVTRAFLARLGLSGEDSPAPSTAPVLSVSDAVTVETNRFRFLQPYQGMEVIEKAGTILALDGDMEITTPYDRCTLIMPTEGAGIGQTAVRLAREEER